jgi:hypothetical protein
MNELHPDSTPQNAPPATTLTSRLTDVFISPSEVFDGVKSSPRNHANWVAPLIAATIVGIIYVMVMFSQPGFIQSIKDSQDKKFQELVAKGQMTQEKADKTREDLDKWMTPAMLKTIWIPLSVFGNVLTLFLTATVLWLFGKFIFHAQFPYMQSVEVAGLALMVATLGGVINLLIGVIYGSVMMNAGPVLLIGHFDQANKIHQLLRSLNLTSLWYATVLSIGLARLSNTSFLKAAGCIFAVWALLTLGPIWLSHGN